MERRGAFHRYQRTPKPISGTSSLRLSASQNQPGEFDNNVDDTSSNINNNNNRSKNIVQEQECFIPLANLVRIMRKVLPTEAKVTDEAKDTIQECVTEYINFITTEANDKCKCEHRKTITAEDILWAMHKLGFNDYIKPLMTYLERYREVEGNLRGSLKGEPLPRQVMNVGSSAIPPLAMPIRPGIQISNFQIQQSSGAVMGSYLGNGSEANSTQQPTGSFDPFAPFK